VDNTLGRLCTEKKAELVIIDEEFSKFHAFKTEKAEKKRKAELKERLDSYRNWLLLLTICDPACGSGAFLNQVLEFLMAEHRYVDELESQLFDTPLVLPNVENHILENNIFGVDINEESVEIARLSLWLRTAKKGRKLSSLNSNIKVGNSLIDDPEVAGDLAFDWQEQFPQVFAKGGFDVVVGNPPYVSSKSENFDFTTKSFLTNNYKTAAYQIDLYILFLEKGLGLLSQNGICSFIVPNAWTNNLFLEPIRKFILYNSTIEEIVNMPSGTFEAANVDTIIIFYSCESRVKKCC
jgi:type I restriction-modification system DNA methylase subunit